MLARCEQAYLARHGERRRGPARDVVAEIRGEVGGSSTGQAMVGARGDALDARGYEELVQMAVESADVQQEVEPLVTLLVTYATNRLNTMG